MIKPINFIIPLILVSSKFNALFSQGLTLRGQVVEASKGVPLQDVHVRLAGVPIGTITNAEGEFALSFDKDFSNDTLSFSIIGYKTILMPVVKLIASSTIIEMALETYVLKEVIVKAPNAKEIVQKAIANIKINYPTEPFEMDAYFKCSQKIDGKYVSFFDAALSIEDPGYHNTKLYNEKIDVIQKRNSNFYNNKGYENWVDNQSLGHVGFLLVENYVKYRRGLLENGNKYEYDSAINYGNKFIHVIKCISKPYYLVKKKDDKNYLLIAKLFIDSETFGILRIEEEEAYQGTENDLNNYSWVRPTNDSVKSVLSFVRKRIEFREFEGKLFPSHISGEYVVKDFNTIHKRFIHENEFRRELITNVVYKGSGDDRVKFKKKARIQLVNNSYNANFWKEYNIIQPSSADKKIFRDLSSHEPIETQFQNNSSKKLN